MLTKNWILSLDVKNIRKVSSVAMWIELCAWDFRHPQVKLGGFSGTFEQAISNRCRQETYVALMRLRTCLLLEIRRQKIQILLECFIFALQGRSACIIDINTTMFRTTNYAVNHPVVWILVSHPNRYKHHHTLIINITVILSYYVLVRNFYPKQKSAPSKGD